MAITYKAIATTTVGSGGAANIEFTSIPGTYTDLLLKISARGTHTGAFINCSISFNSSTSNFSQRAIQGNGSTVSSYSRSDNLNIILINASTSTSSTFSNQEIYIPNYTSSNNKSFSVDDVTENNDTEAYQQLHAGLWSNTAAITSLSLATQTGNFAQYSTATLYGILKA